MLQFEMRILGNNKGPGEAVQVFDSGGIMAIFRDMHRQALHAKSGQLFREYCGAVRA